MKAVIFGAGPCGLTAGWYLARKGVEVTVVEKDDAVGGLCKTTRKNGYGFDLGGHRFVSKDEVLVKDVKNLLGPGLLTRPRKSIILFKDRSFDYPVNLSNVLSQSTFLMTLKFSAGYLFSSLGVGSARACEGSFEAWIDKRFGRPLNDYFFKPYTKKLWGVEASDLSDEWASRRISVLSAKGAILKAINGANGTPRTYALSHFYPENGIGQMFDEMAEDITRLGGKIITRSRPVEFLISGSKITGVTVQDRDGARQTVKGDQYLSTIPLNELASLLSIDTDCKLEFRSLRFLNITLKGVKNFSDNTWIYTPDADMIMTRIQEPKKYSPKMAPENATSIILEIPCDYGDRIWRMDVNELLGAAIDDLAQLGFDLRANVNDVFSTYAKYAYPVVKVGANDQIEALRKKITRFTNLKSLGRQGLFKYIFMDTAMSMGRKWAGSI
ncbi:hypothetical protein MNBD_NITROSPINAE03-1581 [hydrothermal vent metagenome]|uniref:Amine oxidase domain-containing protein n=1 Tax=hydrothermal vent metagenome TaxID=652676 RepID=A0A3B1D2Q5_9ZZZZ